MTLYTWIILFGLLAMTKAQGFDLGDALDDDPTPAPDVKKPSGGGGGGDVKKPSGGGGGGGLDLSDAFPDLNDPEEPKKPNAHDPKQPSIPAHDGGGFSDSDLADVGDEVQPDPGKGRNPRVNTDDRTDTQDDQAPAAEGGQMAGIISAVAVAIFGAASSYFAYQKKKLCFKAQGGTDPESGRTQAGTQSDPQAHNNLLRSS